MRTSLLSVLASLSLLLFCACSESYTADQVTRQGLEGSWDTACEEDGFGGSTKVNMLSTYGEEYNDTTYTTKKYVTTGCGSDNDYNISYEGRLTTGPVAGETDQSIDVSTYLGTGFKLNYEISSVKLLLLDKTSPTPAALLAACLPGATLNDGETYDITGCDPDQGLFDADTYLYLTAFLNENKDLLSVGDWSTPNDPDSRPPLSEVSELNYELSKE